MNPATTQLRNVSLPSDNCERAVGMFSFRRARVDSADIKQTGDQACPSPKDTTDSQLEGSHEHFEQRISQLLANLPISDDVPVVPAALVVDPLIQPLPNSPMVDPNGRRADPTENEKRSLIPEDVVPVVTATSLVQRPHYIFASARIRDDTDSTQQPIEDDGDDDDDQDQDPREDSCFMGLFLENRPAGGTRLSQISKDSPFQGSNLEVGDHIVAVNNLHCSKMNAQQVLSLFWTKRHLPVTTTNTIVSLCARNETSAHFDDHFTVSSSIEKPSQASRVGVALEVARGAVRTWSVDEEGLFGHTLLLPDQRCISINGIPCEHMTSKQAARLILATPGRITIVSRPQNPGQALTIAVEQGLDDKCRKQRKKRQQWWILSS